MTGARVLVVDDSITVRMDLVEALEQAGFVATACATLASARAALAAGPYDLVLLDVQLPDGDGLSLLEELRSAGRQPRVMVLSSIDEVRDRSRGLSVGADEYVGKPYDVSHIIGRAWELVRARQPAPAGVDRPARVLVIDDSPTVRAELLDVLIRAGHEVVTAATGEDGLRLAGARLPDAVLVDHYLPGIDGPTVIRRLRADVRLRHVPCILLTGSQGADQLTALDAGADAYLTKSQGGDMVVLRLAALLRSRAKRSAPAGEPSVLAPKRILVIDDSATFREEIAVPLRDEGYDVALAASGEEGLELLAAQPVDVVLLDMVMPGLSGHETCRRIRASQSVRDVPVIMITGHDDRQALIDGIEAGADDYITKSADLDVLKARIRAQLRRKQFEDENQRMRDDLLRSEIAATEARAARDLASALGQKNLELKAQNLRVEEATRLKSEFLANMSHELRTPLNAIIGFTELIHDEKVGPLTADQKEFLGDVLKSSRHLLQLINDVLDLAKVEAGRMEFRPEPVDLERLMAEVRDIARSLGARRSIDLGTVVDPGLGPVILDASKLKQVLYNYISNAVKFTSDGGRVVIAALPEGPDRFRVEVTDTGIGIAPGDLKKLFVEFSQLDGGAGKRYQGTGLGLALTKRIVEAQGGQVGVRSEVGRGSTFFAVLPRDCSAVRDRPAGGSA